MSILLFFMAFGGILVRPDGFYPTNGMMTTFVILMIVWQGMDWLGQKKILPGLAAVILPLAWPFLVVGLLAAAPSLASPLGFLCSHSSPCGAQQGTAAGPCW